MNSSRKHNALRITGGLIILIVLASATPAPAATFNLRADVTTVTMPDGVNVGMWGFALDSAFGAGDGTVTVPGPALVVPPGDTSLTIQLQNNLTQARTGVPGGAIVSLVIPALPGKLSPVRWGATPYPQYAGRVRSLNTETPPGNAAAVTYTWTGVKPGAYLYHSGTQMQVQVQMGLYGAVKNNTGALTAYPGVSFDRETILLYSEIDPDLHHAVVSGNYGPGKQVTSTIDYHPRYFLVNGSPFLRGSIVTINTVQGKRLLVRLLNAGLQTRIPTLNGPYWSLVAEDGNPYPYPKEQYTALLAAGKSLDAVLVGDRTGPVALLDHAL